MALVCNINDALLKCSRDDDSMISKENILSAADTEFMSNVEDAGQVRFHGCVGCFDDLFPVIGFRVIDGQLEEMILLCCILYLFESERFRNSIVNDEVDVLFCTWL